MSSPRTNDLPRKSRSRLPRTLRRNFLRTAHLIERAVAGPLTPQVRSFSETVDMWETTTLKHYVSREPRRYRTPVMIVPPLMANPVIFDLRPGHSMIHRLIDEGFDTYMLDLGVPSEKDRTITVEDYVTDFIPTAVSRLRKHSGQNEVTLVGWSMGGIMSMLYASIYGEESGVKNAVVLGSPFDFSQMWPFNLLAGVFAAPIKKTLDYMGNVPGWLSATGFRLLAPLGSMTRYLALMQNYHDREYVAAWETMNEWIANFLPYPQEAFLQFMTEFVRDDKLRTGRLVMGGKNVDLKKVDASILLFVGMGDKVASPASVEALGQLVGSKDLTVEYVPVGHIGLVEGSRAPRHVWDPMVEWLGSRSGRIRSNEAQEHSSTPPLRP